MFCSKCGKEIYDEAVVCPFCGCSTGKNVVSSNVLYNEDNVSGGLVFATILIPLVGIIMGIVNLCRKKTVSGATYLITGIIVWIIYMVFLSHFWNPFWFWFFW